MWLKQFKSPTNIFNLPNCLTMLRIVLVPVIGFLLAFDSDQPPFDRDWTFRYSPGRIAGLVVAFAGLTDLLDGWLARRWKIESLLGKFLDPVADKLLLMVGLIMLMKLGRVEEWLVMLLLSREFLITALRAVAIGEGLVIAAGQTGKYKLTFQLVGLGFLMWYGSIAGVSAYSVGIWILYAALFISLFSGFQYLNDFFVALRAKRDEEEARLQKRAH